MEDEAVYKHKIIFFLRPRHSMIIKLIERIRQAGYEVHEIPGLSIMENILKRHDNAFLFINIEDKILTADSWEYAVKNLKDRPEFQRLKIGIFHYNKEYLTEKFLLDLGVDAGFIKLYESEKKLLKNEEIILTVLRANEANGRRKSVRLPLDAEKSTVGIRIDDKIYTGKITDISCNDMGCSLSTTCNLPEKSEISQIIIKHNNIIIDNLAGIFIGQRNDKTIVIFDKEKCSEASIKKISNFIRNSFEEQYIEELKRISFLKDNLYSIDK